MMNTHIGNMQIDEAIERYPDTIAKIIDVAFANYSEPKYQAICLRLLRRFLHLEKAELASEFTCGFLRYDEIDFMALKPFIDEYIKSKLFMGEKAYFFEYLFKYTSKYPKEVLDIMKQIDYSPLDKVTISWHDHGSECVKVVLGAINSLREGQDKHEYMLIASDIFDNIIKYSVNQTKLLHEMENWDS